jgi:ribosomal protein S18 acetylase RimI-like enzyme
MRPVLAFADSEQDARACFPLMRELRPHLASADEFVERWRRQQAASYRLLVLSEEGRAAALAGFRVQENLVHGRHLYVDDLVTSADRRGAGHGGALMDRLKQEAADLRCEKLQLDTPMSNALGHRFYFRHGLLATALRFSFTRPADTPAAPRR